MRLRTSNRAKKYQAPKYFADLDSGDEDEPESAGKQDESSEDEFVVDEAVEAANADEDDKVDEADLDVAELGEESEPESEPRQPARRRISAARGPKIPALARNNSDVESKARSLREVQPYPTDLATKWTRTYVGPVTRHAKIIDLAGFWYEDRDGYQKVVNAFFSTWASYELYPPRLRTKGEQKLAKAPWVPEDFWDSQQKKFLQWYISYLSNRPVPSISKPLSKDTAARWYIPQAETELTTLLGPFNDQKEHKFKQGQDIALAYDGAPVEDDDESVEPGGWMFDVGGIVLSMDWAPINGDVDQLLAMTVIPHSDQAFYPKPKDAPHEATLKQGCVQIWKIPMSKSKGSAPSGGPGLVAALCFEWGRAVRMQWCPVPITAGDLIGLLAILTADGNVRVLEVKYSQSKNLGGMFEEVQVPLATLELKNEYNVEATSFTWINVNRLAVGYSDGSVGVWSLHPCIMIQRHPIHSSPVIDIKSGFPSHPFILATLPTGGVATLTDLNRPNAELVYCPNLLISFQPNLLSWSEHLRGFVSIWPSPTPSNNTISFMAVRTWAQTRFVVGTTGQPTCLSIGTCHPFILVGSTDGSLWLSSPFRRVFFYKKRHMKLKVFQHDYQAPAALAKSSPDEDQEGFRGMSRILHGFKPQDNTHPKSEKGGAQIRQRHEEQKKRQNKKGKKKKKSKKQGAANGNADEGEPDDEPSGDSDAPPVSAGDVVVHDPLTRVSAIAWNPNVEFGCWAAAAVASGLVRVMDLGTDQVRQKDGVAGRPSRGEESVDDESGEEGGDGLEDYSMEEFSEGDEDFVDDDSDISMQG